jgi:hypothetical protein
MSLVSIRYSTGRQSCGTGGPHSTSTFVTRDARLSCKKEIKLRCVGTFIVLYVQSCCILFAIITVLLLFYFGVECCFSIHFCMLWFIKILWWASHKGAAGRRLLICNVLHAPIIAQSTDFFQTVQFMNMECSVRAVDYLSKSLKDATLT